MTNKKIGSPNKYIIRSGDFLAPHSLRESGTGYRSHLYILVY
jgi:hypothetical protein